MKVQLLAITPEPEALIARCARVSHRSEGTGPESDRKLRHILRLRLTRSAQWEIHELARQMLRILLEHAPSVFGDLGGTQ